MASPGAVAVNPLEEAKEAETVADFCQFLAKHYGSVLKAWRFILDPSGDGELLYPEFIEAVASMPPWYGDVTILWTGLMRRARAYADDSVVRLRELSVEDAECLDNFKQWADMAFGGALEVFKAATDGRPNTVMTFFEFAEACRSNGFDGDCQRIFYGCLSPDGSDKGVSIRDIAYLESKAITRKEAMDPGFVLQQNSAKAAAKRMRQRKQRLQQAQADALDEFLRKVRKAHNGSLIRGWRRVLDANGNLAISKTELLKGCQKIAYNGDVVALWKAMDIDDDGIVQLEEVDVQLALVLASFKKWASEENGSCVATMVQLGNITKRQTFKWDQEGFFTALKQAGFPGGPAGVPITQKQAAMMLYEAFDFWNRGYFTVQDTSFLDRWGPTPWLMADPSEENKQGFLTALRSRYPNLIVAWRKVLDKNNSNKVSYKEFLEACRTLKVMNPASIWRALDDDSSGFISLNEIDQEAANSLMGFKHWAEAQFGTIAHMFHVFDKSKVGKVSFAVFKRALRNFDFKGDANLLFHSLKPSGGKNSKKSGHRNELTLRDLLHLSSWEGDINGFVEPEIEDTPKTKPEAPSSPPPPKAVAAPAPSASCPSGLPTSSRTTSAASMRGDAVHRAARRQAETPSEVGGPTRLAPVKETSDAIANCRSVDDYRAYKQAGHRQKLLDAYGRNHNEKLLDNLDDGGQRDRIMAALRNHNDKLTQQQTPKQYIQSPSHEKLPQLSPSRGMAGVFLAPAVASIAGTGRQLPPRGHAGSKSVGLMQPLPRMSPNEASGGRPRLRGARDASDAEMARRGQPQRLQQVVSLPSL